MASPVPIAPAPKPDIDVASIVLEFAENNVSTLNDFVAPSLTGAGLEVKAFYGARRPDGTRSVYCQVWARVARLLTEAERLKWKVSLSTAALRKADEAENRRLVVEEGANFNPDSGDSEHMTDLSIPRADALCIKGRDPYEFQFGPYIASKHHLYHVHSSTGTVLSQSEALQLLRSIIESPADSTTHGAALNLDRMAARKRIIQWYPAHDPRGREVLEREWGGSFLRCFFNPPMHKIKNYFGERVAFYFAFLTYYTRFLLVPAIVGLAIFITQVRDKTPSVPYLTAYGIFVAVYSTVFLEFWKRRQGDWVMKWGMDDFKKSEPVRASFKGLRTRSLVNGSVETRSDQLVYRTKLGLSASLVTSALGVVVIVVVSIFWLRVLLDDRINVWGDRVTAIINAVQITVMHTIYSGMARALTNWENHRTATQWDNSLVLKLAVFQSINCFFNLFWIAAVKNDALPIFGRPQRCQEGLDGQPSCMYEMQTQLAVLIITRVVVGNFNEFLLPMIIRWVGSLVARVRGTQDYAAKKAVYDADQSEVERDGGHPPYETFDDYLELLMQYGFVTLFVIAFPLAPLIALLANALEARLDTYKVLHMASRPMPMGAQSIGAWYIMFEAMSHVSTLTNIAIAIFVDHTGIFGRTFSYSERLVFYIVASHLVFAIKWALSVLIPDQTYSTSLQLERRAYLVQKHLFGVKDVVTTAAEVLGGGDDAAGATGSSDPEAATSAGTGSNPLRPVRNLSPSAATAGASGGFKIYDSFADFAASLGTGAPSAAATSAGSSGAGAGVAAAMAAAGSAAVPVTLGGSGATPSAAAGGVGLNTFSPYQAAINAAAQQQSAPASYPAAYPPAAPSSQLQGMEMLPQGPAPPMPVPMAPAPGYPPPPPPPPSYYAQGQGAYGSTV